MFNLFHGLGMTTDARRAAQAAALALAESLAFVRQPVRAVAEAGGVLVIVQVVPAGGRVLTLAGERKARGPNKRAGCKRAILAAVADGPRKLVQVVNALRGRHSRSSVTKALAELRAAGELVNDKDGTGYRLPDRPAADPGPTLFD